MVIVIIIACVQDGKTLPNGPVVISPDGLFPSLYREGGYISNQRLVVMDATILFMQFGC